MTFEKQTKAALEGLASRIKAVLSEKGIDNTGSASGSLEIQGAKLMGNDYMYYLDKGRRPGKFPPSLLNWVRSKLGLPEKEAQQVDFLIRRKIANEGTGIFKDNSKGIGLDSLVSEMLDNLEPEITKELKAEALKWPLPS